MEMASDEGKFDNLMKEIRHDLVTYDKGDFGTNYEIANERRDYVKKVQNSCFIIMFRFQSLQFDYLILHTHTHKIVVSIILIPHLL